MHYLEAALELKKLIRKANHLQVQKELSVLDRRNSLFLFEGDKLLAEVNMLEYSNEFVTQTLEKYPKATAFVMTDLASMMVKDHKVTYWLYKGYHVDVEKGMVYYQPIEEQSLKKIGRLQFSNTEANIFLKYSAPDFEESSANAMESDEEIENGKCIVFLMGNMNQERLVYDIQRLIFDSASNVQNHKSLNFKFILNISVFNGNASADFTRKVKDIEEYTKKELKKEYPNCSFQFDLEK